MTLEVRFKQKYWIAEKCYQFVLSKGPIVGYDAKTPLFNNLVPFFYSYKHEIVYTHTRVQIREPISHLPALVT